MRVDGGLCGVKVPAGTHHVRLRYVPPGWPWVWAPFGLGLLTCVVVLRRSRK
ncbi:MAG: hypothetical protein Q8L48_27425 [Archangium sp.]|nr:hypothetical protein [Archangium sp.]